MFYGLISSNLLSKVIKLLPSAFEIKELRALNAALLNFGVRPTKDQSYGIKANKTF